MCPDKQVWLVSCLSHVCWHLLTWYFEHALPLYHVKGGVCVRGGRGLILMCFNSLNWSGLIPARNNSHGYRALGLVNHTKSRPVYLTFVSGDRCRISASIPSLAHRSRRNRKSSLQDQAITRNQHSSQQKFDISMSHIPGCCKAL